MLSWSHGMALYRSVHAAPVRQKTGWQRKHGSPVGPLKATTSSQSAFQGGASPQSASERE